MKLGVHITFETIFYDNLKIESELYIIIKIMVFLFCKKRKTLKGVIVKIISKSFS